MDEVELAIQELADESVSAPEYRQTLEKFKVANDCLLLKFFLCDYFCGIL